MVRVTTTTRTATTTTATTTTTTTIIHFASRVHAPNTRCKAKFTIRDSGRLPATPGDYPLHRAVPRNNGCSPLQRVIPVTTGSYPSG